MLLSRTSRAEALALSARTESMAPGVGVSSVGRCHPKVQKAIVEQSQHLMHAMEVNSTRRTELAARLSALMPDGLRGDCITFFAQSGSDALEAAVKSPGA